jgi:hypothetical protein
MKRLVALVLAGFLCAPSFAEAAAHIITVTGTTEAGTTVIVKGIAATVTGTTFTATGVPLEYGLNTITATATDAAGNSSSASITVNLGKKINVQGTRDASAITVTVNGIAATLNSGTFSALVPMTLGINTITVSAQDAAGNSSNATSQTYLARPPVDHP